MVSRYDINGVNGLQSNSAAHIARARRWARRWAQN
jgi:hypothetical protein